MFILAIQVLLAGRGDSASAVFSPTTNAGNPYFIAAAGGSDGNDGLTAATAWRTIAAANGAHKFNDSAKAAYLRQQRQRFGIVIDRAGLAGAFKTSF